MAEVKIYINGRTYDISCDSGQEGRVVDLAAFIDQKLQQISRSGAAYNDAHLMVLTAIVLADELFDTREAATTPKPARGAASAPQKASFGKEDELAVARILDHLAERIDGIATRIQQAS
ncbi:MAG: cell division protein ZapA [Alphaproteobacteria bacterium]|nr:cell division protein ZapA [Alphaproteobacteria bacterium]